MTYCVGLKLDRGLVFMSDTRTNAGLDNISTFRKLHLFETPGERVLALAAAGNLSISQSVVSLLAEGLADGEGEGVESIRDVATMFRAAQLVGRAIREVRATEAASLDEAGVKFEVSFLLGGQIGAGPPRLFMLYAAGNFIECGVETPYLQIGEHKYGKPILDRAAAFGIGLDDALKLALISMDSTMRSNLGVGMPIDIVMLRRDALSVDVAHRIEPGEPYFHDLRERWSAALRSAQKAIPRPPYRPAAES